MKIVFCDICGCREGVSNPVKTFVLENGSTKDVCYDCYNLAVQKGKFINDVIKRYKQEKRASLHRLSFLLCRFLITPLYIFDLCRTVAGDLNAGHRSYIDYIFLPRKNYTLYYKEVMSMNKFYFVAYETSDGERIFRAFKTKEKLDDELKWLNEETTDINEFAFSATPMCLNDFLATLL